MSGGSSGSTWADRLVPVEGPLGEGLVRFLDWQADRWPRLAAARSGLAGVEHRLVRTGERGVVVQWNPGRRVNTTAKVDAATIADRPCFLCLAHLPPEEHGVAFGDLVVLANPAPILDGHLVLAHREHRPQRWDQAVGTLLAFAEATEGALTGVYNGPRSGASAPDHLHLQAVLSGLLPEEAEAMGRADAGQTRWTDRAGGRAIVGFAGPRARVEADLRDAIALLGEGEPDLNLLATGREAGVLALLFPRGAHRPACYFAEGDARFVVSPGAIDMAGVIVTVREEDYRRLDRAVVEQILDEVTLPVAEWEAYVDRLQRRWSHG